MTANGFVRTLEAFSNFDDWYVQKSVIDEISTR
jgi:hypothetical protein